MPHEVTWTARRYLVLRLHPATPPQGPYDELLSIHPERDSAWAAALAALRARPGVPTAVRAITEEETAFVAAGEDR